ncbi:MAG: hypothetical protein FWC47_16935, partial [Oscillospiraceae bacterium]|nr:hypothetical protein [Oscillospiraceae bacterium]
ISTNFSHGDNENKKNFNLIFTIILIFTAYKLMMYETTGFNSKIYYIVRVVINIVVKNFDFTKNDDSNTLMQETNQSIKNEDTIQVKMISNENLFDCKYNTEDIKDTLDLEKSIMELGFVDPIELIFSR